MNQFFKQTAASILGTLTALILFFTLGTGVLVFLAVWDNTPQVKAKSVLVLDLSVPIQDTSPPADFNSILTDSDQEIIPLRQAIQAIDKAAQDNRIVGIFLDGRFGGGATGYGNLKEIRTALQRFKDKGKKIIAYDVDTSEREYYLTSLADTIILNPLGTLEMNGLSSEQLFFTGALEKYGVGVQVVRVGSYKAAVEPVTNKSFSGENREQTEALLTDLWEDFLSTVAPSRELTARELQDWTDTQGFLTPTEAESAGFIDRVAHFDEVIADLKALTGVNSEDESFRKISLKKYSQVAERDNKSSRNTIAIVYGEGSIVNGEGNLEAIGGERLARSLRKLRQDDSVKAVILRVNSPGGSATASDIILREVELTRESKPVIVSMGNVAASGGYWIATGADYIFAQENTITGSIGVFGLFFDIEQLGNNNGLTWDVVKTGRFADINTVSRPKTKKELDIYQGFVDEIYDLFLAKVASSRKLPLSEVANIAQGRVWSGIDAKEIGLVDEIGGLEEAIAYTAAQAELGEDWQIEEYPKHRSFQEEILEKLLSVQQGEKAAKLDPLTAKLLELKEDLSMLQTLNDPRGIYTRLPFSLHIK